MYTVLFILTKYSYKMNVSVVDNRDKLTVDRLAPYRMFLFTMLRIKYTSKLYYILQFTNAVQHCKIFL